MINQLRVLLSKQEVYSMGMRILLFNFIPLAVQVIKVGCSKLQPVTELVQVGCYNANCCGQEFCRVGDDSCLILWDARTSSPVVKVEKAHNVDIHCVDWNPIDENLIVTGSADNTIRLFDHRNLSTYGIGSHIHIFENHTSAVLCVQWSPDKSSVFGSLAEDEILNVWDHNKIGESYGPASKDAHGLLFRHSGHRYLAVTSVH